MSRSKFLSIFDSSQSSKLNFQARLLGLFSEEIVGCWCKSPQSPYNDLHRPVLKSNNEKRGSVLDFAFECKENHSIYVGELKCWPAYENQKYLTLTKAEQLREKSLQTKAFQRFLELAKNPSAYVVEIKKKKIKVAGAILVWARTTADGRRSVMDELGMRDVLSLEDMVTELIKWNSQDLTTLVQERARWSQSLFEQLLVS